MKGWDERYAGLDAVADAEQIYALNTDIENFLQETAVSFGVVELVKWWVSGPDVLKWDSYRHNENAPNSFDRILLDE